MSDNQRLGDRYELGPLLGHGGMAEVRRGTDLLLGRDVAIKTLRADLTRDPIAHERFRREAQSAAILNHPAIVQVFDVGEAMLDGVRTPYIVMELVEGETLRQQLIDRGRLTEGEALAAMADVADAMDYSHRHGIIHRDIKPANVMVSVHGDVKVMDFGIARALEQTNALTQTATVMGTAQYLSPEQAKGAQLDTRTDIYSAGCVLYELLTGRPPFTGESPVAVAYQHVREAPVPPSGRVAGISPAIDTVVLSALAKDREQRYATAKEFGDDCRRAMAGEPVLGAGPLAAGAVDAAATTVLSAQDGATTVLPAAGADRTEVIQAAPMPPAMQRTVAAPVVPPAMSRSGTTGQQPAVAAPSSKGPNKGLIAVIVLALLIGGGLLLGNLLGGGGGNEQVRVPSVIGQSVSAATQALDDAGFKSSITRVESDQPVDEVLEQNPLGSTQAAKGSTVELTVSAGQTMVRVPSVVGQSLDSAKSQLTGAGLTLGTVTPQASDRPKDEVLATVPQAGNEVAKGTAVNLTVASGRVQVPQVTGLTAEQAASNLTRVGFSVATRREQSATAVPGTVIRQTPSAGTAAEPGSSVTIYVAVEPPAPTPTPTPTPTPSPTPSVEPTTAPPAASTPAAAGNGNGNGKGPK